MLANPALGYLDFLELRSFAEHLPRSMCRLRRYDPEPLGPEPSRLVIGKGVRIANSILRGGRTSSRNRASSSPTFGTTWFLRCGDFSVTQLLGARRTGSRGDASARPRDLRRASSRTATTPALGPHSTNAMRDALGGAPRATLTQNQSVATTRMSSYVLTAYICQCPGTPFSSCSPRSSNSSPEPATRSGTVRDTRTSPGDARL